MEVLQVVSGFVVGYFVGSYVESVLHEYVSDALPKYVRMWNRFPVLLRPLIRTHYSHHIIHHTRTWRKDHVTQFRNAAEKAGVDKELDERGRHGYIIRMGSYATTLYAEGGLVFSAPPLVASCVVNWISPVAFGLPFSVAVLLPVLFSWVVHPYLHMPFRKGQQEAPRVIAWLLSTAYFRAMYRHHFMHHRYGGVSNFNLALGADYFRGRVRKPSDKDMAAMKNIGMPL